jgi:hypothetical protein
VLVVRRLTPPAPADPITRDRRAHKTPAGIIGASDEDRVLANPTMSNSEVVACFIGAFFGLVAAALLIAFLG